MSEADARLLRVLGLGFALAVSLGNTIAAGIFRVPGDVAGHLPHAGLFLLAWAACGAYALVGALQIAELGTMLPRSGGQYVFARHALGEYPGFVVGWSDWISTCGAAAAVALLIGEYTAALARSLEYYVPELATAVAVAFAIAQWRGIREGSRIQAVTSLLKMLAFAVLLAAAFSFGGRSPAAADAATQAPSGLALITAFVLAVQGIIFTYDGWTGPVYFSEELRDPARELPRSLFGGVLTVIAVYLLVNLALLYVVPMQSLAGDPFAAGTAARILFGEGGERVLRILTVVSLLSAVNAYHLMASRVLFAMSRDGLLTNRVASVNAGGTPTRALLLGTVAAVSFVLLGRTSAQVITIMAFFYIANYTLSFVSVFVLRFREPHRPRPYRAWGYPWTTALALLASLAFLLGAMAGDTRNSLYACLLLAASYPIFRILQRSGDSTESTA
jgi:APA family basic amino acid/polyamine antiporter